MSKTMKMVLVAGAATALFPALALAQATPGVEEARAAASGLRAVGVGVGAGLALIGAGLGLGMAAKAGLESIARQPDVAGKVGTNMLIMAAFIEGAALFAIAVSFLILILG